MTKEPNPAQGLDSGIPPARRLRAWLIAVLLVLILAIGALAFQSGIVGFNKKDPLFRGKLESEWIKNLKYSDDQQVKEWQGYGEEGVQVLIRGLQKANHSGERTYRRFYRLIPASIARWMPAPKNDSTQGTRQCVISLLSSLGTNATSATPVMIWSVTKDESDSVRQSALCYFNSSEDDNCILNKLPADQKAALLPALLNAVQNSANWGLRNNAALALRYYPEQQKLVAPVLVKALQDSQPQVQLLAADALNRVDPEAAMKAGTTSILVAISKNQDDQIAFRAVAALGHAGSQPELAVPALIECLQSSNNLVACQAVWALEWSGKEFASYSNTIVPALSSAAQRNDNVGRYAKNALARWTVTSGATQGATK